MDSRTYMLGFYLNAMRKGHRGCVLDAARALHSVPDHYQAMLGLSTLTLDVLHRRMSAWFNDICEHLQLADSEVDDQEVSAFSICQRITRSPLTSTFLRWPSVALDGTDFPSFANMHTAATHLVLDGDAVYDAEGEPFGGDAGPPAWALPPSETVRRARIYGIGADDRRVYTRDTEARAGYRTTTAKQTGGTFVGYEATTAIAMPTMKYTDGVTTAVFDPTPPPVCLGFNLTPAGTHRGQATLAIIQYLNRLEPLREAAADRGITLMLGYLEELRRMGIKSVHTLTTLQRGQRPGPVGASFVDATLLSTATPPEMLQLPLPPIRASEDVRAPYEAAFNLRAQYRWRTLSGPDAKGRIRLCCPICTAKVLRCRQVPETMRLPSSRPLVALPSGQGRCCDTASVTFGASDYPLWMGDVVPFTTAHNLSYGRRNAAETGNSFLHGLYVDIDEKWAEPFGTVKRALLLAFTLAGLNHYHLAG